MITIKDNDLPITVAEKIVNAIKPYNPSPLVKAFAVAITGQEHAGETQYMFDLEEIKEIADYLLIHYEARKKGD